MESTYSATLSPPAMIWEDQTSLADQKAQTIVTDIGNVMLKRDRIQFLCTIYRLADSTYDGGVCVRLDYSRFNAWISLHREHISKVLLHPDLGNYLLAYAVGRKQLEVSREPVKPHLEAIHWIETATGLPKERIGDLIGVTRQTINRWEKGEPIRDHNRRYLFAVREVLERASLRYPTPNELAAWIDTPRGADGRSPAQLLEANEINRARLLAVSSPSPRLRQVPSWVNQPVPEAFRAGAERRQQALPPDTDNELIALITEEQSSGEDGEDLPVI